MPEQPPAPDLAAIDLDLDEAHDLLWRFGEGAASIADIRQLVSLATTLLRSYVAALERPSREAELEKWRDWIDNHEYVAAYPSLTACLEDQRRGARAELEVALQRRRVAERVAELQAKARPTKAEREELAILTYDGPVPRVLPHSDETPF